MIVRGASQWQSNLLPYKNNATAPLLHQSARRCSHFSQRHMTRIAHIFLTLHCPPIFMFLQGKAWCGPPVLFQSCSLPTIRARNLGSSEPTPGSWMKDLWALEFQHIAHQNRARFEITAWENIVTGKTFPMLDFFINIFCMIICVLLFCILYCIYMCNPV